MGKSQHAYYLQAICAPRAPRKQHRSNCALTNMGHPQPRRLSTAPIAQKQRLRGRNNCGS
jgi:hypothetical protein